MPIIMLLMYRKVIAQSLMDRLLDNLDIRLVYESDYENATLAVRSYNVEVVLIEAAESGPYNTLYCLNLCKKLKTLNPRYKLLIMCSEQQEENVKLVVEAKGKKQIDDFVFYDVTIDYLASKLISI